MARPTTPPTARSSSTSDGGTVPPCGSARARSGVVTCAKGVETTVPVTLDMLDYALGEGGGRDLGGVGHQAGQVVGDASRPERALEPAHDRRRDVRPAQLLEHHRPRQDHTPGVHLVEPGVLGRRAVGRLVYGVAVAHVTPRPPSPVPLPTSLSGTVLSPKRSLAISYPHSRNPPSVNFMMLPLCTSVTERRPTRSAYAMALATRRWLPNFDIGLMPIALPGRIFAPKRSVRNAISASASGVLARYSTPE